MDSLRFFNPYEEIRFTENLLPHWQQNGVVYFITFRLADSIPTGARAQWEEERATWLRFHPEPWDPEPEQGKSQTVRRCHRALARRRAGIVPPAAKRLCQRCQ